MREVCSISFLLSVFPFCYLCFLGHGLMFRLLFYRCGSTLPTFFCRIKDDGDGDDDEDGATRACFSFRRCDLASRLTHPRSKTLSLRFFVPFFALPLSLPLPLTHSLTLILNQPTTLCFHMSVYARSYRSQAYTICAS